MEILLTTNNRLDFTKQTLEGLELRLETPYTLIVVDNNSKDGTLEYLRRNVAANDMMLIELDEYKTISEAQDIGFQYIEGENFIMMQDDIIIPKLKPDVIDQLVAKMNNNLELTAIACRIQHIPNVKWGEGYFAEPSTALSCYFRINRTEDVKEMGGLGTSVRDDVEFVNRLKASGKKGVWANDLWCNHLGHGVKDRGYKEHKRAWGVRKDGTMNDGTDKPYPEIDPITNRPLNYYER